MDKECTFDSLSGVCFSNYLSQRMSMCPLSGVFFRHFKVRNRYGRGPEFHASQVRISLAGWGM